MEIKLYRYLVIILVFVVLLLYYLFRSFIEKFDRNTKTIFIVVIILTELNLFSIYLTLSNYEKNKDKVGEKGEKGLTGLPGNAGDPEVCNLCLKEEPTTTTTTASAKPEKVLLDIIVVSENSQKELDKKLNNKEIKIKGNDIKLQDYTVINKYITERSSGKFDALLAKFDKPKEKEQPITNLIVKEKGDECKDKVETSGNVLICIEKVENEKPIIGLSIDKKADKDSLMPLNYNLNNNINNEESLYLNIKK